MLVELLPKEELKSASGLIIRANMDDHKTSTELNRANLAVVLAVGNGYYDEEDGTDVPMDVKPGSVVLLSQFALRPYSEFPGIAEYTKESIALTRESEVHCAWPSIEAYLAYREKLNG